MTTRTRPLLALDTRSLNLRESVAADQEIGPQLQRLGSLPSEFGQRT